LINLTDDFKPGDGEWKGWTSVSGTRTPLDCLLTLPYWTANLVATAPRFAPARPTLGAVAGWAKFVQCLRLFQINTAMGEKSQVMKTARALEVNPILVRIGKLTFAFLIVIHYVSCAYQLVGRRHATASDRDLGYWAYYASHGRKHRIFERWAHAYYWSITSILGNYTIPSNAVQALFNVTIFILGITMTSMITGSITSMLANSDVSSTRRREKMTRVREYMRTHAVPEELSETITEYYDYLWETDHRDEDLFSDLTDSLRLRLTIATKRHFIHSCAVFQDLDQFSVIRLIMALKQLICVPDEIVAAQGEIGTSMYFVSHGELTAACIDDLGAAIVVGHLHAGDHFGEAAILEPDGKRNATVRAVTFCELFALKFDELFANGDEDRAILLAITSDIHQRRVIRELSKRLVRVRVKLVAYAKFMRSLKRLRGHIRIRETALSKGVKKVKGALKMGIGPKRGDSKGGHSGSAKLHPEPAPMVLSEADGDY
jgi:CRP-like cAMP-binding protein